jgi:hypothetical protein
MAKKKKVEEKIEDGRFPDERAKEYMKIWNGIEKAILNNGSFERATKESTRYMYDSEADDLFERGFVCGAKSLRGDIEKTFMKFIDNPELLEK